MRPIAIDIAVAKADRAALTANQPDPPDEISVSNTACRSNADRLITFSTSAVAVCCCSASARSFVRAFTSSNRRTFSIAMTAWSAKVRTISMSRPLKETRSRSRETESADDPLIAHQWHAEKRAARIAEAEIRIVIRVHQDIGNIVHCSREKNSAPHRTETGLLRIATQVIDVFGGIAEARPVALSTSPSRMYRVPYVEPESSTAERTSVSSTNCKSNADRLMTLSMSPVAVCCRSASVRSRVRAWTSSKRRAFSIAITDWLAKVSTSSICRVAKGAGSARVSVNSFDPAVAQQGYAEQRSRRADLLIAVEGILRVEQTVWDLLCPPRTRDTGNQRLVVEASRVCFDERPPLG